MKFLGKYKGIVYLAAFLIVIPLGAYCFAIKDTVSKWQKCRDDKKEIIVLRQSLSAASGEENDFVLDNMEMVESGEFLTAIAGCVENNKLFVEKYFPVQTRKNKGVKVITAEVSVSGDYLSTVKLIDYIEKSMPSCKIISANFKSVKDRRNGNIKLTTTLLIQQITSV